MTRFPLSLLFLLHLRRVLPSAPSASILTKDQGYSKEVCLGYKIKELLQKKHSVQLDPSHKSPTPAKILAYPSKAPQSLTLPQPTSNNMTMTSPSTVALKPISPNPQVRSILGQLTVTIQAHKLEESLTAVYYRENPSIIEAELVLI